MHPYSSNKANTAHGYTLPGANRYKGRYSNQRAEQQISDYGPYPFATNMEQITKSNQNFRTALWTGDNLQITLMSLLPGEDIVSCISELTETAIMPLHIKDESRKFTTAFFIKAVSPVSTA